MDNDLRKKALAVYGELSRVIRTRRENGIYTAMGFTSDLDVLLDFQVEKLNELLERYVPDGVLEEMKPAPVIRNERELLETIVSYCIRGAGGEADMEDIELIRSHFSCQNGMGGNAVQAALALAQFGGGSIVHLTDDSFEVREQLDYPCIRVALPDGTLGGSMDLVQKNPQEIHVILQYQKGNVIRLGKQEAVIPDSNRLILNKNTINMILPLDEDYLTWIETNARQVSSDMLSSFNYVLEKDMLRQRLERILLHVERYRRGNPEGVVYYEDGYYRDMEIRKLCIGMLFPEVDILSMNEEELLHTLKLYGEKADLSDILSCVHGVETLIGRFGVKKGVVIHTKDYAMYVGDRKGFDIEKGMFWGNMLATAKALFGNYGSDEEVKQVLELPFSEAGLKYRDIIREHGPENRVVLIPTFYLDKPKYTIGLGDSFTGGMQLCF